MNEIFDAKIQNKKIVNKSNISEFINNTDLDEKINKLAKKKQNQS